MTATNAAMTTSGAGKGRGSPTVTDAIKRSGVLDQFPHIDLARQKVGVFGRLVKPDAALSPGDRVEIYRGIIADPETVPRRDLADD